MSGLSPISPASAASNTMVLPPAQQAAAQSGAFGGIQGLTGSPFTGTFPAAGQLTKQQVFNPFAPEATAGANTAMTMGTGAATNQFNLGGNLETLGQQVSAEGQPLINNANQVMQTAFDPQSALYNRYLQLQQQQFQATNAASGVGSTPYAAGLNAQNLQNFNISWQAQQLQNQIAGLNSASTAYGTAGGLQSTGANISQAGAGLQAGAAPLFMQSAMYPYATSELMGQTGMQALSTLMGYGQQGTGMTQQQISDYMSLLGLVPQEQQANTNAALAQSQIQQAMVKELGAGVGAAGSLFTGAGGMGALSNLGSAVGVPGSSMFTQH
jgi:hypothetical protein